MLLLWKALLVLCYGKSARGWQSWVSVLAERGPHCSTCPCTAQLHRTLVHSPGTAPREAGTQPGLSCTGIWDAGSWWAETCTKVERSNLDIQDPAGPSLSLAPLEKNKKPLWQVLHHLQRFAGWTLEKRFGRYSSNKGWEKRTCGCSSIPDRNRVEVKSFPMTFNKQLKHECGS